MKLSYVLILLYIIYGYFCTITPGYSQKRAQSVQSLQYLHSGPCRKKNANPWFQRSLSPQHVCFPQSSIFFALFSYTSDMPGIIFLLPEVQLLDFFLWKSSMLTVLSLVWLKTSFFANSHEMFYTLKRWFFYHTWLLLRSQLSV